MRTDITNQQLQALAQDIKSQSRTSPAFFFFNKEKIRRFHSQNAMALKILNSKTTGFVKEYAIHDAEGNPVLVDKDGQKHYTFTTPEVEKAYLAEMEEFLGRTVKIEL